MDPDLNIPVVITVYADRLFTFETKMPPAADLLKKARNSQRVRKAEPGKGGHDFKAKIEEIAKTKLQDLNTTSLESAIKTIEGTARQMGLTVEYEAILRLHRKSVKSVDDLRGRDCKSRLHLGVKE